MAKKHHKKDSRGKDPQRPREESLPVEGGISSRGKKTIAGGILLLVAGFYLLTLTDPAGRNWASVLSPVLILGAYGVIAWGIFRAEAPKGGDTPSSPSAVPPLSR